MSQGQYKTVSKEEMKEEWLVIQAAQQDPAAFRPLYDRYYSVVFKFIFKRTADENLTAEICSLVFLKALKRLDSFEFRGVPFSAWLLRIAGNELGQHFRKVNKTRVVSIDENFIPELAGEVYTGGEGENYEEMMGMMVEALDELKEADLLLIEMRFFEQLPFKDIAEILQITESNAKVKTYRILERMKKSILKKHGPGFE
ncbi:MAG: sigma-70 family RNA polymerase sigma factor [Saprospiraceae bacterium]